MEGEQLDVVRGTTRGRKYGGLLIAADEFERMQRDRVDYFS